MVGALTWATLTPASHRPPRQRPQSVLLLSTSAWAEPISPSASGVKQTSWPTS
jgi:hypothetical protein